ncbi:hypothetical protein ABRQ03_08405 [Pectobacterium jejuense]|uniref:hypothetical protein n=1 Tax=Pectobacterium jejuense TaxID=2974022 RepID=UPI0032EEF12C
MKVKLTIDGNLVDPDSPFLSEKLSAEELNELVAKVANDLKQQELQILNDTTRNLKG